MKKMETLSTPQILGLDKPQPRQLKHRRTFCFEVYEREDGLWDIDAQMQDVKTSDITLANQTRNAGEPVHNMCMRVTLDNHLFIVDASAKTLAAPYMSHCELINPDYKKMIGLNVLRGFRAAMKERFEGTAGCTHLSELAMTLPTVAVQGIGVELAARLRAVNQASGVEEEKPFQLEKCHALSTSGEVARLYYPKWYVTSKS